MTQLEKAKKLYQTANADQQYVLESLFPELTESEDERIRKELIKLLRNLFNNYSYFIKDPFYTECIAWLEKQHKQESVNKVKSSAFKSKLLELFQRFRWYCKDKTLTNGDIIDYVDSHIQELIDTVQNKPWSEEDEKMFRSLHNLIYVVRDCDCDSNKKKELSDWIESLKCRCQSKQEWSEEDENILQGIWDEILANKHDAKEYEWKTYDKFLDWLKSLRPQSHWKPSDEQMKSLKEACDKHWEPDGLHPLYTLYQDLKKLRE